MRQSLGTERHRRLPGSAETAGYVVPGIGPGVRLPSAHVPERVHHDGHLLLWQVRGSATVVAGRSPVRLRAAQAIWIPAGLSHSVSLDADSVLFPVLLDVGAVATALHTASIVEVCEDLATLLLADVQREMSILGGEVDITRQILAYVERDGFLNDQPPMPASSAALVVASVWRRDPGDPRRISELARLAHVSVRTLERQFVADTGLSARAWRSMNRVEAAKALLRTATTVGGVARRVGFADDSAFVRAFRAAVGVTPGAFAAAART